MRCLHLGLLVAASTCDAGLLEWLPGRTADETAESAFAVSDDATVVLGKSGGVPVVWFGAEVHELMAPEGVVAFDAISLSPDGSTVVGWGQDSGPWTLDGTWQTPIAWPLGDGVELVGEPAQASFAYATDVSANGEAVVGFYPAEGGPVRPARWTAATGWRAIAPHGGDFARISADGRVVAGSHLDGQAFRWTPEEGARSLGGLPGGDGFSFAVDVSSNGRYIAGHANTDRGSEAFLWSEETGMRSIFEITPELEYLNLVPTGVADTGEIVGIDWRSDGSHLRAFIWDENDGLRYLDDLVSNPQFPLADGPLLPIAHAITADGRTIVGDSLHGGWVLRLAVPEASSAVLLITAAVAAGLRIGRRR